MKKIALLLAMVMLLVCVLASCGGTTEESKADTSKDTSTVESQPVEDSKEASEEPENSTDESEGTDESKDEGPTYAEGTTDIDRTLAPTSVTKGLDTNELVSTRTDPNDKWAPITYEKDGETYNKLTDGVKSDNGDEGNAFFGTQPKDYLEVIIDLSEKVEGLADFSVWTAAREDWGIVVPDIVQFFVSDDGENWLPIADPILGSDVEEVQGSGDWKTYEFKYEMEKGVSAQYVKFVINRPNHIWLGEVNVDVYK